MPRFFLPSANKGRRIVMWTLAAFALSQFVLSIYLDRRRLETRDPLYGYRVNCLRQRLVEAPNASLFLIMGSSRVKYSIWPDALKLRAGDNSAQPIIYNFGLNGMGTIRELMYYRRLLADGMRPKWILLEVWPPLWAESGFFSESRMVQGEDDLHWRDLPLIWRYFRRDRDVLRLALRHGFLPVSNHRDRLIASLFQPLLPRAKLDALNLFDSQCLPADRGGWFPLPWETTTAEAKRGAVVDGEEKIRPLLQPVRIDPRSDAALRELLADCRQRDINVALILLPEPSWTRGWYTPPSHELIRDYLTQIQRDYANPIIDARDWVVDSEFADSCHMSQAGVPAFCERLGREVVQPLMDNRPLADSILFLKRH
jgi:hypothetical protein